MTIKRNTQKGFTLIETVMYIALFTIVIGGTLVSAYQLIEGGDRNRQSVQIQEEGTFLQRKINWALTGATNISVSADHSTLTITRPDLLTDSPLVIKALGGEMTLQRGLAGPVSLSANAYLVTDLSFTYYAASGGRPPAVYGTYTVQHKPFEFKKYLRQ